MQLLDLDPVRRAHMTLFAKVVDLLRDRGDDDVVVFGGGIIPDADVPELE